MWASWSVSSCHCRIFCLSIRLRCHVLLFTYGLPTGSLINRLRLSILQIALCLRFVDFHSILAGSYRMIRSRGSPWPCWCWLILILLFLFVLLPQLFPVSTIQVQYIHPTYTCSCGEQIWSEVFGW
jgi:hypothetical protein